MRAYQIAVLGSHRLDLPESVYDVAFEVGKEIARRRHTFLSGCSTGVSYHAAKGAKEHEGFTIGISPFATRKQNDSICYHYLDNVILSGLGYKGRNILTVRSADGIVVVNGGFGTLNEVTIAEGENKPIVAIEGTSGCADKLRDIFKEINPSYQKIGFRDRSLPAIDYLIKEIENERS